MARVNQYVVHEKTQTTFYASCMFCDYNTLISKSKEAVEEMINDHIDTAHFPLRSAEDYKAALVQIREALANSPLVFDSAIGHLKDTIAEALTNVGIDPHGIS